MAKSITTAMVQAALWRAVPYHHGHEVRRWELSSGADVVNVWCACVIDRGSDGWSAWVATSAVLGESADGCSRTIDPPVDPTRAHHLEVERKMAEHIEALERSVNLAMEQRDEAQRRFRELKMQAIDLEKRLGVAERAADAGLEIKKRLDEAIRREQERAASRMGEAVKPVTYGRLGRSCVIRYSEEG